MTIILLHTGIMFSQSSNIIWLRGRGFYMPYIFAGVYLGGLILGWRIQKRSNTQETEAKLMMAFMFLYPALLFL